MAGDARRTRGRQFGSPRLSGRDLRRDGRRAVLHGCACAGALLVGVCIPAAAQDTVIIGSGTPVIGRGGGGVVINNEVLDGLGPSAPAPALPYVAPAPPFGTSLVPPGGSDTAFRQPDTGQLMITRPGTLLFPPSAYPTSRLTGPARGLARATAEPELTSRLLVPLLRAPPSAPPPAAKSPPPSPKMAPVPVEPVTEIPVAAAEPEQKAAPEPEPKAAPEPEAAARPKPEPSQPAQAPTPSTLVRELTEKPTAAPEKPPSPTREAKAEPTPPPSPQLPAESKVQPAAPPAPLPPATAAAEPELPPQPAKSLTQDPVA